MDDFEIFECTARDVLAISGELTEAAMDKLDSLLGNYPLAASGKMTLDLTDMDVDESIALTRLINSIRSLRDRLDHLVICGAPQILGHNLYRINELGQGHHIELIDMREDEAYG